MVVWVSISLDRDVISREDREIDRDIDWERDIDRYRDIDWLLLLLSLQLVV